MEGESFFQLSFNEAAQFAIILMAYNIVIAFCGALMIIASNRGKK